MQELDRSLLHCFKFKVMARTKKFTVDDQIQHFRLVAAQRKASNAAGLPDNRGAIHGAERVLGILCQDLCYPGLTHLNNLRHYPKAHFSEAALQAYMAGEPVEIEHVSPHRALTIAAIQKIEDGATDQEFKEYLLCNYKIVLLTKEERRHVDKHNRSKMEPDRLERHGIRLVLRPAT
jgi:hypothetical protein